MKTIVLAIALTLPLAALAHNPYTVEECQYFGMTAGAVTAARDAGQTKAQVNKDMEDFLSELIDQHMIIKDEGDLQLYASIPSVVFNNPDKSPDVLQEMATSQCIKALTNGKNI